MSLPEMDPIAGLLLHPHIESLTVRGELRCGERYYYATTWCSHGHALVSSGHHLTLELCMAMVLNQWVCRAKSNYGVNCHGVTNPDKDWFKETHRTRLFESVKRVLKEMPVPSDYRVWVKFEKRKDVVLADAEYKDGYKYVTLRQRAASADTAWARVITQMDTLKSAAEARP